MSLKLVVSKLHMLQLYNMATGNSSKRKAKSLDTDQQLIEKIGKRIKSLRIAAGYTNAETFAFEHRIGRSQYAEWERGKDMKATSINRIAAIHDLTVEEFFEGMK